MRIRNYGLSDNLIDGRSQKELPSSNQDLFRPEEGKTMGRLELFLLISGLSNHVDGRCPEWKTEAENGSVWME